nr:unnamed protein product [Callosobruchus chinensis]
MSGTPKRKGIVHSHSKRTVFIER